MKTIQLEKLRACGRLEAYSTARHHMGFYNNTGLTATFKTSSTSGVSLQSLVFNALHHVIAQHSNLCAIPVNEDKSYPHVYWARLPSIDLRTCVEFRTRHTAIPQDDQPDEELDKLLSEHHSRGFEHASGDRPCWRLVMTSMPRDPGVFTASWIFHHALSDGSSGIVFHESLLKGLNTASAQKETNPVVHAPSEAILPPLEELHPMSISWSFFLRTVAGSVLPSHFAQRPPSLWTCLPVDAIIQPPAVPYTRTTILSAETTKAFAKRCHDEGTSVTAVLSTLLAAMIFPITYPQNEIRIDIPISVHSLLPIPEGRIINAIANTTLAFNCAGQNVSRCGRSFRWETARRAKQDLVAEVNKKGADNPIALLRYVSNMHEYFVDKLGKQRDTSVEISNLGVYRPRSTTVSASMGAEKDGTSDREDWKLGRMTFSQSLNRTGAQFGVSVVTGADGCMVMSFCWPRESLQYEPCGGEGSLGKIPELIKGSIEKLLQDDL